MHQPAPLWPAVAATFFTGMSFAALKFVFIGEIAMDLDEQHLPALPFVWMDTVLQAAATRGTVREAISQGMAAVLTLGVLIGYSMNAPMAGALRSKWLFLMSSLGVLAGVVASYWINPWLVAVYIGVIYGTACAARGKVVPLYAMDGRRSNTLVSGLMNATLVIGLLLGAVFGSLLYDRLQDLEAKRELRRGVLAVVLSLAALASLFIRPREVEAIPFRTGLSSLFATSRSMIRRYWALLIAGGLAWGIGSAASLAAMIFAVDDLHLKFSQAAIMVLFPAVGAIVGNLVSHWMDKRRYVIGAYIAMAAVVASFPLVTLFPVPWHIPITAGLMVLVGMLFAAPTNVLDAKLLANCAAEGDPGRGSTSMSLWHNVFILVIGSGLAIPLFLGWMSAAGQFYFLAGCTLFTAFITGFTHLAAGGGTVVDADPVSARMDLKH